MSKIAFVTASPETISSFLLPYINKLAEQHQVHVITSLAGLSGVRGLSDKATVHDINIHRDPKVTADIKSLWQLFRFFRLMKFDAVHSFTPKAGLLTQLSAFFARIPIRIHTFTGQVWATKTGLGRLFLKSLDKITASLPTTCLVDSPSQRDFLIAEGLTTADHAHVLGKGSVSGVNLEKFSFNSLTRENMRTEYHLSDDDFVFLFVGRLKKDKGVVELTQAFKLLSTNKKAHLFVIGSDEENLSPLFDGVENIHFLGFKTNVADFYSFADVLCLPSHREGFGNVIIEAAACKLPALASNIYGLSDAVEDGYSGILHPVTDTQAIKQAMTKLLENDIDLAQMKINAHSRVVHYFAEPILVAAFLNFYNHIGIASNNESSDEKQN